jgi:hypothetical protein
MEKKKEKKKTRRDPNSPAINRVHGTALEAESDDDLPNWTGSVYQAEDIVPSIVMVSSPCVRCASCWETHRLGLLDSPRRERFGSNFVLPSWPRQRRIVQAQHMQRPFPQLSAVPISRSLHSSPTESRLSGLGLLDLSSLAIEAQDVDEQSW